MQKIGLYRIAFALLAIMKQYMDKSFANSYNVGPEQEDCITTGKLADLFVTFWGNGAHWNAVTENTASHEAKYLQLDCSKIKKCFDWKPVWYIEQAIFKTVTWYKLWNTNEDLNAITENQIEEFFKAVSPSQ